MLLTQLQQDTKGNIKDIFLLRLSPTLSVVLTQLLNTLGFLIENAQRHFQGSLFGCFEYVPYTALTIVLIIKTINVRLD